MENPLRQLATLGQSVWYDNIRRGLIDSGDLKKLIVEDGLRGITSNPSIFEKAIAGSTDYSSELDSLAGLSLDAKGLYEHLAIHDIQDAADMLRPVYEETKARDGYVSLEVSPTLAHDTAGTIGEAQRLWASIARPNVMIKVPATPEGIPAIRALIGQGINVNVTLLFAQEAYERVAEAFIAGIEDVVGRGGDASTIASVASFFVSRIDTLIDGQIDAKLKTAEGADKERLKKISGKVAISNAKLTYQKYKELYASARWRKLAEKGAQTQRLLWASTSTKNPAYRDVYYVEELIGPDTVDTVPPATFDAFRQHGQPKATLEQGLDEAKQVMASLPAAGISMKDVTQQLLDDGVKLFADAFQKLVGAVEKRRKEGTPTEQNRMTFEIPADLMGQVSAALEDWLVNGKLRRLWSRDASLWTQRDEASWMGWLAVTEGRREKAEPLIRFAQEAQTAGYEHVLLLGMGGSSLCPEVFKLTFGKLSGHPELLVLDSTDPQQVRALESKIDLNKTLFIVASKSGGTMEPNIFKQYFFEKLKERVGAQEAGRRFVAITDPGSSMEKTAQADGFGHIFHGVPSIGGRYSALSAFGMGPAAAMGLDINQLYDRADQMVHSCSSSIAPKENPGVVLGAILGVLGKGGRNKVTIAASPGIHDIGAWLEQLLAESTGKEGKGLIPVDREEVASPDRYGSDRLFVYLRLTSAPDAQQDRAFEALAKAGHPVVRVEVKDAYGVAQEFFRWEFATAVAGSILGINPFDQPDVEASKIATRKLTTEYEKSGSLGEEKPVLEDHGVKLFTDTANAAALEKAARAKSLAGYLRAHLERIVAGDYFAVLGYVAMNEAHERALQQIRHAVRDSKKVATCLGFGPRFLHSTGQAYKGGPNTGVFLQITCEDANDLPIPGQKYTFGVVKAAQARGDFDVLSQRGRRALRVHLGKDVGAGLAVLNAALKEALS